jgi:probable phosphoglycerate mutase
MRLIFIRHAEPDYSVDGLTPSGYREADALARRVAKWPVTAVFCSPLGRAKLTAKPCLEALHLEAETLDWLREIDSGAHIRPDGSGRRTSCPWDLFPDYWTKDELHFHPDKWATTDYMRSMPKDVAEIFRTASEGIDGVLARYGYHREGRCYRIDEGARRDANLVFFCHLGLIGVVAGHLLNISPMQLWHSFWLSPSSVTILPTEERQGDIAGFRCQVMGDTSHLLSAGEPISKQGSFIDAPFEL